MATAILKPNPEKKLEGKVIQVRDPIKGDWLPAGGRAVNLSVYWLNRLRYGEVVRCDAIEEVAEPELTLSEKLTKMTVDQLVVYAKENLNLEFTKKPKKQDLIDQIIAETELQTPSEDDVVLDNMTIDELKQFAIDNGIEISVPEGKDETQELILELIEKALESMKKPDSPAANESEDKTQPDVK